jgi:hypothetical protein
MVALTPELVCARAVDEAVMPMARAQDTRPEAMREVIERFMTCSPYPKAISAIAFTWISAEQSKKVPKRF